MAALAVAGETPGWEQLPGESGHSARCRCARHGVEFGRSDTFKVGANSFAHGVCPECLRHPKRPDDLEPPDYWKPVVSALGALRCEHHQSHFGVDEACRGCIEDDWGTDELDRLLREKPVTPVRVTYADIFAGRA